MEEAIPVFFQFQCELQVYHWMTRSHSRHEATGDLYDEIVPLLDKFIEVYIGSKRRPHLPDAMPLTVFRWNHQNAPLHLKQFYQFMAHFPKLSLELANIRDEILGLISRTLYRFTQK
jgi:hypothetical protein